MNRTPSIIVSLLLVIALGFNAGCATTKDGRKTQAQGTAIGVVGGALLGAALGLATGNRNNIARFAIAGAAHRRSGRVRLRDGSGETQSPVCPDGGLAGPGNRAGAALERQCLCLQRPAPPARRGPESPRGGSEGGRQSQ